MRETYWIWMKEMNENKRKLLITMSENKWVKKIIENEKIWVPKMRENELRKWQNLWNMNKKRISETVYLTENE